MVEEMLAARGVIVSHETVRPWARKFGQEFADQIFLWVEWSDSCATLHSWAQVVGKSGSPTRQ